MRFFTPVLRVREPKNMGNVTKLSLKCQPCMFLNLSLSLFTTQCYDPEKPLKNQYLLFFWSTGLNLDHCVTATWVESPSQ